MPISDCSSDLCSSYLLLHIPIVQPDDAAIDISRGAVAACKRFLVESAGAFVQRRIEAALVFRGFVARTGESASDDGDGRLTRPDGRDRQDGRCGTQKAKSPIEPPQIGRAHV